MVMMVMVAYLHLMVMVAAGGEDMRLVNIRGREQVMVEINV